MIARHNLRHAELVSASVVREEAMVIINKETLNQVQGDEVL